MVWIARFKVVIKMIYCHEPDDDEDTDLDELIGTISNSQENIENELDDLHLQVDKLTTKISQLTTALLEVATEVARIEGKAVGVLFTLPTEGEK
jgi:peptidoglycan hydrolase CwlO-like protein